MSGRCRKDLSTPIVVTTTGEQPLSRRRQERTTPRTMAGLKTPPGSQQKTRTCWRSHLFWQAAVFTFDTTAGSYKSGDAKCNVVRILSATPNVMLLVSMKSKTVFQTDTLYSCLLSLVSLSLVSFSLVSFSLTHSYRRIHICFIATENSSVFNLCCTELVQHNHIHSIRWPFTHPFTCNTFTFNWPFVHATGTCTTHIPLNMQRRPDVNIIQSSQH